MAAARPNPEPPLFARRTAAVLGVSRTAAEARALDVTRELRALEIGVSSVERRAQRRNIAGVQVGKTRRASHKRDLPSWVQDDLPGRDGSYGRSAR